MKMSASTILDTIGNTPLLELRHITPANDARVHLIIESQNPTGSMKDRMALAMISAAEADGRLKPPPPPPVVEYTGGSTGVSLALICTAKKHPIHLVTSDAFSKEKIDHMRLLGAELTILSSKNGKQTEKLTKDMIREAHDIAESTGAYITAQVDNIDQLLAYTNLAGKFGSRLVASSMGSCKVWGHLPHFVELQRLFESRMNVLLASLSSSLSLLFSLMVHLVRTTSMALEPAMWYRGTKAWLMRLIVSQRKMREKWRFAWPEKKVYFVVLQLGSM